MALGEGVGVGGKIFGAVLWLWVAVMAVAYLVQFAGLLAPIAAKVGLS